jgi:Protein of unknown function (DUF3108)
MARRRIAFALAAALALPLSAAAAVEPVQTFSAEYSVSFLGLTVARSTVVSRVGPNRYDIKGEIESAGLASFFDDTRAKTSASGRIGKNGISPETYTVKYTYGEKAKQTTLDFAKGNVVKIANSPPLPKTGKDWVPVGEKELRAVFDPLSAVLVRSKDARSVCNHTLKAFDGQIRANLAMSYVNVAQVPIDGDKREVVTCAGRFQPVAGYHRGNKSLQYLSTKSRIVLKFAELGKTGIYAPVQASVSTKIGTFSIRARRIEASQ